ncbi:hypothetical protein [Bradyrhizobium sp. Arg816]|uniref:hypothetical protein n=1 Tax=Bradyrhizobium sp. Arg816 TaxID=2998491 RepID=UPI00249E0BA1|nr:hypothetical protein [Bradyrhizobium sp. Arg816]MDI3563925.1 hypothetical protein [Bradyrhizobium sp. Arg816]
MNYSIAGTQSVARAEVRSIVYISALALAAAYFLAWPVWRAQFFIEIWFTESWNAYWQDVAAAWRPIYPAAEALIGNNYPPLSFYAVGILGKLLHVDNLYVGRWLSLVGLGALAVEVFLAVRILTGGKIGAAVAALWYVAIMARNSTIYVGANDPQIVGLAIMGAALVWFLRRTAVGSSPTPALLLMVVAGFWKHNNVAIPLTALAWLHLVRSKYAYRSTLASAEAVVVGLAACIVVFGANFIPNLLATRQYAWSNVIGNIGHLQWSALALLIWAAWAVFDRSQSSKFTALHIGFGLSTCIVQWLGHGVFGNAEFDFLFALAIGLGVAFNRMESSVLARRIGPNRCRDAMIVSLLLRLFLADRQETALLALSPEFREAIYASERNVIAEARAVAEQPGDVACFVKLVCRLAGKPFVVDEFKTDELVATGKATPADIAGMLEERGIRYRPKTLPTGPEASRSISRWWGS